MIDILIIVLFIWLFIVTLLLASLMLELSKINKIYNLSRAIAVALVSDSINSSGQTKKGVMSVERLNKSLEIVQGKALGDDDLFIDPAFVQSLMNVKEKNDFDFLVAKNLGLVKDNKITLR